MRAAAARAAAGGLLALALALRLAGAQWPDSATTQPEEIIEPLALPSCLCSDVAPRDGVYYNVTYTCLQQLVYGNCGQAFMRNAVKELSEGYCQVTCGRCDCCRSVADVLQANGATSLLAAARVAGLDRQLAAPASMFTLLAPTDAAFEAALPSLGVSTLDAAPAAAVAAMLQYHIIPPHPGIDAVWTAPFFGASDGAAIPTALPDAPLRFTSEGGRLTVTGASNSATLTQTDIEACKSYINLIDAVLLPPAGAAAGGLPLNAGNIAAVSGPAPSAAEIAATVAEPPTATAG